MEWMDTLKQYGPRRGQKRYGGRDYETLTHRVGLIVGAAQHTPPNRSPCSYGPLQG